LRSPAHAIVAMYVDLPWQAAMIVKHLAVTAASALVSTGVATIAVQLWTSLSLHLPF
jgi:hypothetical protein